MKRPAPEWNLTFPAVSLRCPNCGHVSHVRSSMSGRFRMWVLKGRGWKKQGLPSPTPMADSNPL